MNAFQDDRYDYYELTKDLGGILPKGTVFVHDTDDSLRGSPAQGCLKLCWTPDGNCYGNLCGGTVVFHAEFRKSNMFRIVKSKRKNLKTKEELIKSLDSLSDSIKDLKKELLEKEF